MIAFYPMSISSFSQSAAKLLFALDRCRRSPDQFQRVAIVALSAFRALNFHCGISLVPGLLSALDAVPAFDFYGFLRLPRDFLFPYTADRIEREAYLKEVTSACSSSREKVKDNHKAQNEAQKVSFIAQKAVLFLEEMERKDVVFSSEADFKHALVSFLRRQAAEESQFHFEFSSFDLRELKVPLVQVSPLERMISASFIAADLFCVPDFLENWEIINLSQLAQEIGGRVAFFVGADFFGQLTWAALFSGYFFQLIHSLSLLSQELPEKEKKAAAWTAMASLGECIYSLANLQKREAPFVNLCALVAKSLGTVAFFYQN